MIQLNQIKLFFFQDEINITVDDGEVLCILGPSGCGKTSLLKAIKGFFKKEGTVVLNEIITNDPYNYKIGFVHQQPTIYPHLSIIDNLLLGNIYVKKENKEDLKTQLKQLIKAFKLENVIHKAIKNLSVGEKQRLAIVRCLMMNPQVIIMDEPSSALDPINVQQLINIINKLKQYGLSIIIASHDIHFVKKISDKIIFLAPKGQVLYQGNQSEFWINDNKIIQNFINI